MEYSQNGYSVIERDDCKFYDVGALDLPLRADDCGFLLSRFVRRFARLVEPIGKTETFGHAKRQISNSNDWSNHASGTAVDINSSQHPYGAMDTFSNVEHNSLRGLLADFDDVVKWGGDYRYTKDEMHFEINKPYSDVHLLARVVRRNGAVYLSKLEYGKRNLDVYMVKRNLKRRGFFTGTMNDYFSRELQTSYAEWQKSLGYEGADADGVPGKSSLEQLGFTVK
jgi:hypothetical protein